MLAGTILSTRTLTVLVTLIAVIDLSPLAIL